MTVMVDLMEQGTCRYKKLKSPYMYLHLNPTSSPTHISPTPFWTKHGFAHVDETLVIPPLTPLEAVNPTMQSQHALTTTVHAEVLAGLQSLRELQSLSPRDGQSSDTDEGLVVYYRAHTNPCPAVPHVTDAAQQALAAAVARMTQNEATARQVEAAQQLARDEADKELKAKSDKEAKAAADMQALEDAKAAKKATDAAFKLAKNTAFKRYAATTQAVAKAEDARTIATATCIKAHQDVVSSHEHVRVATMDKGKAKEAHTGSRAQLELLTAKVAVKRRQKLETQVLQDTAMVEAVEALEAWA
jgi:hypothetical protein